MTKFDISHCLKLARSENVGSSTFFRLINIFNSPQNALSNISEFAKSGGLKRNIKICSDEEVANELLLTSNFGAKIFSFYDEKYPKLLKNISDPPPILTTKGNSELFSRDIIAIVGPRNASFNAINTARNIANKLGENNIVIASGLARGVDSIAHEASINLGTIAVIAGGINHIYPQENHQLYQKISENGLLVSENSFNFKPRGGNFIQRNRIIAGISLGVVIVEAGLKSGSLTTARFARSCDRDIFAVPGSPFDDRCKGSNRLIKEGAILFEEIDDILREIPRLKQKFKTTKMEEEHIDNFVAPQIKLPIDAELREISQEILKKLSYSPTSIEVITNEIQAPIKFINIALVQLELAGKIRVDFGNVVLQIS